MSSNPSLTRFTIIPPKHQTKNNLQGLQTQQMKNSPIRLGQIYARTPKKVISAEDRKRMSEVWERRMKQSQFYDSQKIEKQKQISTPILVALFLMAFAILYYLTPLQTYHPELQ